MPNKSLKTRLFAFAVPVLLSVVAFQAAPASARMRIALICSGSTSDGGWNQAGRTAILKVAKQLRARVSVLEKVSPDRAGNVMRDYVHHGYNLVIGHGYEFLVPATEAAAHGHHTHFAVSGADKAEKGIQTLNFDLSQPCYQLGVLAAMVSKTGHLGFIGGEAIPAVKACYRGFLAGARSVNPHATVAEAYSGWDQPQRAKSQAQAFINQHVDVILQNVDAASTGIFEAVKNADRGHPAHPVYVFGSNSNQNNNTICPRYTLASAVIRLDRAFLAVAKQVQSHAFKPGVQPENLKNGVCIAVLNPKLFGAVITPAMRRAVQAAGKKLLAGKVRLAAH